MYVPLNAFNLETSLLAKCFRTCRAAKPKEHRPCRMGALNPGKFNRAGEIRHSPHTHTHTLRPTCAPHPHIFTYTHVHTHTHTHMHSHIPTHTHTYSHTRMHTHKHR